MRGLCEAGSKSLRCHHCSEIGVQISTILVVTSDKEKAIRQGLTSSELRHVAVQMFCSLHAKWNVTSHKYVPPSHHSPTIPP